MASKGWIEKLPSGRYRARSSKGSLGTFDTPEQAQAALDGGTLAALVRPFVVRRRKLGYRDVDNEEARWRLYFESDPIAAIPLNQLSRAHVRAWWMRMLSRGLAPQTLKNARNVGSALCADAVEIGLVDANHFSGLRLPKSAEARPQEGFTVLDPDEQLALLRAVDDEEYHMVAFALHTGMRNSELWRLKFEDLNLEAREVVVRYSRKGKATKGGRIRRLPLIGLAVQAAEWAIQNRRCEYVWPSPRTGQRRYDSSHPSRWSRWIEAAGIDRHVRFYDLRHTCATSLLAGWWGRKWSLDEVRQMLGHSSVKMTERYAHLIDETLHRAGAESTGLSTAWRNEGAAFRIRTGDLRFTNSQVEESLRPLELVGFEGAALRQHIERTSGLHGEVAVHLLDGLSAAYAMGQGEPLAGLRLKRALAAAADALEGGAL